MTAVETYAALIDAVSAQRRRIHGHQPLEDHFGGPVAQRFRYDPHRSLDANLPDLRVLPDVPLIPGAMRSVLPETRQDAVHWALQGRWLRPEDQARARDLVEAHFHELFARRPEGFLPLWYQAARQLLITWETDQPR